MQLNVDATIIAAPGGFVAAADPVTFQFDATGNLVQPAKVWSNQELNPQNNIGLGTYYLVTLYDANGARINQVPMWWQFTEVANSTVDISTVTPFATVGGNVIFYPTSFAIPTPTSIALGGVFSNAGAAHKWIASINTDGTVTLSQPAFTDLSGTIQAAQLPSVFGATEFTGGIQADANITLGVVGTTSGQITMDGSTSGSCTITAPAVAGTATNPINFSNSINIPSSAVYSLNTDTGISRASAAAINVGNGTAGNATGTIFCAVITTTGLITAKGNLQAGLNGTAAGVLTLEGGTSGAATITAPAIAGTTSNPIAISNSVNLPSGTELSFNADTGISRDSAGVIDIGNGTVADKSGTINAATINAANLTITGSIISKYNNIATAGSGVAVVYAATSQKAESGADANVLTFTPPAVVGSYRIRFVMSVSAANAATLGWTATWTDSNGNAQTPTNLSLFTAGTAAPALTYTTSAAGDYYGYIDIDVNNAAANIVIKLTFTGTSFAAKVTATVERLA